MKKKGSLVEVPLPSKHKDLGSMKHWEKKKHSKDLLIEVYTKEILK